MTKTNLDLSIAELLAKPAPQPIQVFQSTDGYMAVFSETHIIAFGGESRRTSSHVVPSMSCSRI